jgi:hypothetical protein
MWVTAPSRGMGLWRWRSPGVRDVGLAAPKRSRSGGTAPRRTSPRTVNPPTGGRRASGTTVAHPRAVTSERRIPDSVSPSGPREPRTPSHSANVAADSGAHARTSFVRRVDVARRLRTPKIAEVFAAVDTSGRTEEDAEDTVVAPPSPSTRKTRRYPKVPVELLAACRGATVVPASDAERAAPPADHDEVDEEPTQLYGAPARREKDVGVRAMARPTSEPDRARDVLVAIRSRRGSPTSLTRTDRAMIVLGAMALAVVLLALALALRQTFAEVRPATVLGSEPVPLVAPSAPGRASSDARGAHG